MNLRKAQLKTQIRKLILKKRSSLPLKEQQKKSLCISQSLIQFVLEKKINKVLSYMHHQSEVQTSFINHFFLKQHFQLGLPRVSGKELHFFNIHSLEKDLETGFYGLLEPKSSLPISAYHQIQCAIIPGLAFDLQGFRIGYGKGFYDRFLAKNSQIPTLALAYNCQLFKSIPHEDHDIPLSFLITENKTYHF